MADRFQSGGGGTTEGTVDRAELLPDAAAEPVQARDPLSRPGIDGLAAPGNRLVAVRLECGGIDGEHPSLFQIIDRKSMRRTATIAHPLTPRTASAETPWLYANE